jgi:hypothetical protein
VERGTFAIDGSRFETVDRVRIGNHFYSDKPVLPICWLAGIYAVLHHAGGLDFVESRAWTFRLLTFFGVGGFSILLAWLFYRRVDALRLSTPLKCILGGSVVLTTWVFSYGTTINNHTPAACLLFALFCLLDRLTWTDRNAWLAGLIAGVLFNFDFPTGGLFFLAGALWIGPGPVSRPKLIRYLGGFSILVALMLIVDMIAYGNILPAYLVPGGKNFEDSFHSQAYAGLRRPLSIPDYWLNITLGQRGIFSYMPVLLFAFPSLVALWKSERRKAYVVAGALAATFVYYGMETGDYGGWAYGFRFLIPLVPILFWYAAVWLAQNTQPGKRAIFAAALAVGLITSCVGAYNPWPVAYEGAAEEPGAVQQKVRNTFTANLLCISFQLDPKSGLTRLLSRTVYDYSTSRSYLMMSYLNMRRPDLIDEVKRQMPKQPSD